MFEHDGKTSKNTYYKMFFLQKLFTLLCVFLTFVTAPSNNLIIVSLHTVHLSLHELLPPPFLFFPPHPLWFVSSSISFFPHFTSSPDESRSGSALSVPSSAGALSGIAEPLDISVLGRALEALRGYYCFLLCFFYHFRAFLCCYI